MPAPSCPPTTGSRIGASPFWIWSSEWHRPAAKNLILISFAFGSSSSSSVISHGWPGARQTAARVVMLMSTLPRMAAGGRRHAVLTDGRPRLVHNPLPVALTPPAHVDPHNSGKKNCCQGQGNRTYEISDLAASPARRLDITHYPWLRRRRLPLAA